MHHKYGKEGFAAVSVALDDPNDKEAKQNVLKFLESKKATFTNLILDEKEEVWQEKLKIQSVPAVFVIGRDGKIVKKFTDDVSYADVEKLTVELLKKK
jgi:peroxiredoxin